MSDLTEAEKALNLWLLWTCANPYVGRYPGLCSPWVLDDGRTIASDYRRLACVDAGATLPVLFEMRQDVDMKRPDAVKIIDERVFLGQWPRLEPIVRTIEGDDGEGRWTFFRETNVDGLRVNAELLWPFSLLPGVECCRDGDAILLRWKGGRGVVLGFLDHEERQ